MNLVSTFINCARTDLVNDQSYLSPNIADVKNDVATSSSFMNNIYTSHIEDATGWFQLQHE